MLFGPFVDLPLGMAQRCVRRQAVGQEEGVAGVPARFAARYLAGGDIRGEVSEFLFRFNYF